MVLNIYCLGLESNTMLFILLLQLFQLCHESGGHRTGKGQFSFQSQRKAMSKNAQTTAQSYSSHMLVK